MIKIAIIGTGALARNLFTAFSENSTIELSVYSRNQNDSHFFTSDVVFPISNSISADYVFLAVSDSAIHSLSKCIDFQQAIVMHSAGSVALTELTSKKRAVFYPIQTFNKTQMVDFKTIPIGVESDNTEVFKKVLELASLLSSTVFKLDSNQRKEIHLAAVWANNFSNYCFGIAKKLLIQKGIKTSVLHELIKQTAINAIENDPVKIQSGPAKRGDLKRIQHHIDMLTSTKEKEVYQLISNAIIQQQLDEL